MLSPALKIINNSTINNILNYILGFIIGLAIFFTIEYITNEIKRVMDTNKLPKIRNIIIQNNEIYEIDEKTLSLSKDLIKLSSLMKGEEK